MLLMCTPALVAQSAGPGLPAQVRNLTVQNAAGLTLTQTRGRGPGAAPDGTGNLTTGGRALTLLSSAAGTALVDNSGGAVLGTATVQRYVSGATFGGTGYRHFSAPTGTATVGSLATPGFVPVVNPAYNGSAAPGQVVPFPTVYAYDQSRLATSLATGYPVLDRGWRSPLALTDPLQVGHGYTAHLPAGQTVQFTGPLNNGPLSRPLARAATPALDAGWHLAGNPYPSPLDWRLLAKPAGLDDALYVFQSTAAYAGQYRAFVNGLGPASPLIGSGQGFFVRVTTAGATPALAFTNAARVTTYGTEPALSRGTTEARPVLRLTLAEAANPAPADEVLVYFEAGATAGADARFDAAKLPNSTGLNLATLAGAEELAIDGRPPLAGQPLTIPLAVAVPRPGSYAFAAAEVSRFAPGAAVYLVDALTGTRQRLTAGATYACVLAGTTAPGRFALVFYPAGALATAAGATATLAVYPNPAHEVLRVSWAGAAGPAAGLCLTDALGREVRRQALTGSTAVVPTADLPRGLYLLHVVIAGEATTRKVVLE